MPACLCPFCFPGYPPFYSDDPLTTCRKIVNWRMFLKFPEEISISPAAKDLIQRLMCDVDDRLGTKGVEVRGAGGKIGHHCYDCRHMATVAWPHELIG